MPLVTGVVVLIFGGLTLWLQDDTFIKMKPTIVNSLFAVTLLGGLLFGQSLLKYVFGDVYKLKPKGWFVLTWRWGLFFFFLAVANEVVWRMFDTDTWVAFKVWGIMPHHHRVLDAAAAGADEVRPGPQGARAAADDAGPAAVAAGRIVPDQCAFCSWSLLTFSITLSPDTPAIWSGRT